MGLVILMTPSGKFRGATGLSLTIYSILIAYMGKIHYIDAVTIKVKVRSKLGEIQM